jgi:hypothetical protein
MHLLLLLLLCCKCHVQDQVAYRRLCRVALMEGRSCGCKCYPVPAAWSVTVTCDVLLCKVGFGQW